MEFASKDAESLAEELNVNPQLIQGTGKHDRITAADVRRGAEEQAATLPVGPPDVMPPPGEPEVVSPPEGESPVHVPGPPIPPKEYACVQAAARRGKPKPPFRGKPFAGLTQQAKLDRALRHFKIRKSDIISYRVYPHKVAIVYGPAGKKATYWVNEIEG